MTKQRLDEITSQIETLEKNVEQLEKQKEQLGTKLRLFAGEYAVFADDPTKEELCKQLLQKREAKKNEISALDTQIDTLESQIQLLSFEKAIREKIGDTVSSAAPFIPIIQSLIEENKGLAVGLIAYIIETVLSVSDGLDGVCKKIHANSAKNSKSYYDALTASGFTPDQAFQLLLSAKNSANNGLGQIASNMVSVQQMSDALSSLRSKNDSGDKMAEILQAIAKNVQPSECPAAEDSSPLDVELLLRALGVKIPGQQG